MAFGKTSSPLPHSSRETIPMRSAMRLHLDFKLHSRAKSCSVTLLHMHADRSKMPIFHDAAAAPRRAAAVTMKNVSRTFLARTVTGDEILRASSSPQWPPPSAHSREQCSNSYVPLGAFWGNLCAHNDRKNRSNVGHDK